MRKSRKSITRQRRLFAFFLIGLAALSGPLCSLFVFELSATQMFLTSSAIIVVTLMQTSSMLTSVQNLQKHAPRSHGPTTAALNKGGGQAFGSNLDIGGDFMDSSGD
ncbi:MAG: hypothetical protein COB90_10350 [Hyphomicrobiales bacterium]|nr:MAG: hypothetical protein COB90_10350 [Hyphomicrobiales bacterium]